MDRFVDLCKGKYYAIPANQRGYSWQYSHIDDILKDLMIAGNQAHYFGPLIVSRDRFEPDFQDDERATTARYILEDGQQRFTTFLILINAIRLRLEELSGGPDLRSKELAQLLFYQHNGTQLRLQNENTSLNDCIRTILTGSPAWPRRPSPPMLSLRKAAEHIRAKFSTFDESELIDWKNRLLNQAKFVWVDLQTEGINRYLAFDAINSRGLPLSELDKIKNFCILVSQERALGLVPEDEWYRAIQNMQDFQVGSRSHEESCITDLFSAFHNQAVTQSNVHSSFVQRYRVLLEQPDERKARDFEEFIDFWEPWSKSFAFLISPNRSNDYGNLCTKDAGSWLDRLDNMELPSICRILLVACHIRMSPEDFAKVARACEIYTFRVYAVMRYRKDKNSKAIISLAQEVLRLDRNLGYVLATICKWMGDLAPMSEVLGALANGENKYFYDPKYKGWAHTYYFLYEYELFLSPAGVPPLPWAKNREEKVNTQEHILPQNHRDSGWWESEWPDDKEADDFKHRLGNLVLSAGNSVLKRKSIGLKIEDPQATYYYNHRSATNSEKVIRNLTDGSSWRSENIIRREHTMLEFTATRWSMPCCSDNSDVNLPLEFRELGLSEISVNFPDCIMHEELEDNSDLDPDDLDENDGR